MKNPDRIQPFMEKLAGIWSLQPNMRFAQIIELVKTYRGLPENVFFLEDDMWSLALVNTQLILKNPKDFHEIQ